MIRKVKVKAKAKVKSPKKGSLERMGINLYGDDVTAPKLELPTAQFGAPVLGRSAQPDPGNIRSTTKTSAIEEAKRRQEAKDQGVGKTIGLGVAGFLTGALSSIPIIGGAFEGLNEKVQEKDKSGAAGIASGIGKTAVGTTSAVLSGGTMGTGEIAEGVGDVMGGSSEIAYNKGNDKKSERLGKAEQAFDTIAPIADMASGFIGAGAEGAEGAEGMFKGPEGIKGGMKSLLGGMPSAKFGRKLPLEMELMPEGGKMVDGYLHKEGGVITKHRGKPVAEIEGGEGITKGGVVFSDTTINPETGKPFSKDAKKVIKIKDENTRRLAEEELYIKQEKAKEMQGLVNRGEEMAMKKYKKGGSLKAIPSDNKGLPQLPESVSNQMGYMKSDGGLRAKIHVKNKIRVKDKSKGKSAKPRNNNYTMDEYNSFENYAGNARQTLSTNDVARLNELGFTKTYNLNDFSRGFNKLQQPGGTLDQNFLPNFKDGGKASKSGKNSKSPKNSFTDLGLRSLKVLPESGSLKLDTFKQNKFNYEIGTPSIQGDIYSSTETTGTGKPKIKSFSERLFRNADGSLSYFNKNYRGGEGEDGEDGEGGEGNLTPGDIAQLAGNAIAPFSNFLASKEIGRNTARSGRDRSIIEKEIISNADKERTARQESAATRAGLTKLGSDAMKSAVAAGATKAIQDAQLEADRLNIELGRTKDQLDMQRSQFNVGQADKEAIDKQTRKDLAITARLTGAEQTGKLLVDLGLTKNQGLTNSAQLKILQEAFPDYTIDADNMKAFVRKLASNGDITRFRTNPDN